VIRVCIDDLAFFDGEAIVRPVNEDLGATTPLLRRLELAAGTELHNQIRLQEPLPVGAAIVTSAGELSVELLVHAVVMGRTEPVTADTVRRALTSALQRVTSWQIKNVAIPPFGLGAGKSSTVILRRTPGASVFQSPIAALLVSGVPLCADVPTGTARTLANRIVQQEKRTNLQFAIILVIALRS